MAKPETKQDGTKVNGGPARASYAHVFVPTSMEPDDPKKKYSICLLIPKSNKTLVAALKAGIKAAQERDKAKWKGKIPANLRSPLRDGDIEKPEDENYKGMYFINASSPTKPGVVGTERDEEQKLVKLTTDEEFYSGCWCRFSINFFGYNTAGNQGVGAGLNHLQKVKDDVRLAGRPDVESEFDEDWTDDASEDDDMMGD